MAKKTPVDDKMRSFVQELNELHLPDEWHAALDLLAAKDDWSPEMLAILKETQESSWFGRLEKKKRRGYKALTQLINDKKNGLNQADVEVLKGMRKKYVTEELSKKTEVEFIREVAYKLALKEAKKWEKDVTSKEFIADEVAQRTFDAIVISGEYDQSLTTGEKINYIKMVVKSQVKDVCDQILNRAKNQEKNSDGIIAIFQRLQFSEQTLVDLIDGTDSKKKPEKSKTSKKSGSGSKKRSV